MTVHGSLTPEEREELICWPTPDELASHLAHRSPGELVDFTRRAIANAQKLEGALRYVKWARNDLVYKAPEEYPRVASAHLARLADILRGEQP